MVVVEVDSSAAGTRPRVAKNTPSIIICIIKTYLHPHTLSVFSFVAQRMHTMTVIMSSYTHIIVTTFTLGVHNGKKKQLQKRTPSLHITFD